MDCVAPAALTDEVSFHDTKMPRPSAEHLPENGTSPFSRRYTVQHFLASHVNLSEIHDVSTMLHGTSVLERLICKLDGVLMFRVLPAAVYSV